MGARSIPAAETWGIRTEHQDSQQPALYAEIDRLTMQVEELHRVLVSIYRRLELRDIQGAQEIIEATMMPNREITK